MMSFLDTVKYRITDLTVETNAPDYVNHEIEYDEEPNILHVELKYSGSQVKDHLAEIISERLRFDTEREIEIYSVEFEYQELTILEELELLGYELILESETITILEHKKSGIHISIVHSSNEIKLMFPNKNFTWFTSQIDKLYDTMLIIKTYNTEKRLRLKG